jgi:hypothetical protein
MLLSGGNGVGKSTLVGLQREIRHGRRNVGALKLSNLLQPDRFEEDLNISRVTLSPPKPPNPLRLRPLRRRPRPKSAKPHVSADYKCWPASAPRMAADQDRR